jgi:hypothetical protein
MKAGLEVSRQWGQDGEVGFMTFSLPLIPLSPCHFIPLFYSPTANSCLTQLNKQPTTKLVAS